MPKAIKLLVKSVTYMTFGLAFVYLSQVVPARADDATPFQMEDSHWMSFDHYKDNVRHGITEPTDAKDEDQNNAPAQPAAATTPVTTSSANLIAPPTRPLDPPVMPGVNNGYDVRIDTTDDDANHPGAEVVDIENDPNLHLRELNWQRAGDAAKKDAEAKTKGEDPDEAAPLGVRMSFLPSARMTPVPKEPKKMEARATVVPTPPVAEATPAPKPAAQPADPAACAAIDAYKKRELAAIQSDRETLSALQNAIAALGLQKQLSFMTNTQGGLNTQAAQNTSATMDMPAPSSGSAKP